VTEIGGEFGQVRHLALLPGRPRQRDPGHGRHQRFVVRQQAETAAFQEEPEMAYCRKRGQELTIESGVPGLSGRQFFRKESQRLPVPALQLLQDSTNVSVRGINRQ
jgi:hypothetical protein